MAIPRQTQDGVVDADLDVLVVDDSDLARAAIVRVLTRAGLRVGELATPIGLTQALIRKPTRVVVIDFDMPSLRGDRVIELLRRNPRFAHIKLVLFSGHELHELAEMGVAARIDAYISKSLGPTEIVSAVRRLLDAAESQAG
jgi:DNA-binding NarL/FixJ family response regulator